MRQQVIYRYKSHFIFLINLKLFFHFHQNLKPDQDFIQSYLNDKFRGF